MIPIRIDSGENTSMPTTTKDISTKSKRNSIKEKAENILNNEKDKENITPNIGGRISSKVSLGSFEKIARAKEIFRKVYGSEAKTGAGHLKYLRPEKWWEFHGGAKEDNNDWLKSDTELSYPEYLLEKYGDKSQVPVGAKYFTEEEKERCKVRFEDGKFYAGRAPISGKMKFVINEEGHTFAAEVKKIKQKDVASDGQEIVEQEGGKVKDKKGGKVKKEVHHSSFLAGRPIASGGVIKTDSHGQLTEIQFGSGHYLTDKNDALATLKNWVDQGVVLEGLECSEDFRVGREGEASIVTHYDKEEVDAAKYYREKGCVLPEKLEFKLSADETLGAKKEEVEIGITPFTTAEGEKGYVLRMPDLTEGSRVDEHIGLVHQFLGSKGFINIEID